MQQVKSSNDKKAALLHALIGVNVIGTGVTQFNAISTAVLKKLRHVQGEEKEKFLYEEVEGIRLLKNEIETLAPLSTAAQSSSPRMKPRRVKPQTQPGYSVAADNYKRRTRIITKIRFVECRTNTRKTLTTLQIKSGG